MKNNQSRDEMRAVTKIFKTQSVLLLATTMVCLSGFAKDRDDHYLQVNLVSDQPGVAMLQDTNLVNAWGISFGPTSPFWVSDNGSGKSTLYGVTNDAAGQIHVSQLSLVVNIPGEGTPTGQLFDGTGAFHGDIFIFASEDGIISGWRGALGTNAEVLVSNSNAVYKGITMVPTANGPVLLAANFAEGTLDAYGTNLELMAQFADPHAPPGYAPFNVLNLHGMVFVTFAKQDSAHHDDVPGRGHGLIDVFDINTEMFHRFVTGSDAGGKLREIDSPWGLALSPGGFGAHSDELLVGNFGSGAIMSFNAEGKFQGLLKGRHEKPIVIDGLWGLTFGNGTRAGAQNSLFFSAGPDHESHGLFGALELAPDQDKDKDKDKGKGHGHDNDRD